MQDKLHLVLRDLELPPGTERSFAPVLRWCFIFLREGIVYGMTERKTLEFLAGELLIVPPGGSMVIRASQLGRALLHFFDFQPNLIPALVTLEEQQRFMKIAELLGNEIHRLRRDHELAQRIAALCVKNGEANAFWKRCELLALGANWFSPHFNGAFNTTPTSTPTHFMAESRFHKLVQQIPVEMMLRHSPEEVAKLCRCSPTRFRRLFRAKFGVSFRSKMMQLRLENARRMVLESDASLHQIAVAAGYSVNGTFAAAYKKHFGVSPNEARRGTTAASPNQPS